LALELVKQQGQIMERLVVDEEKLSKVKTEYGAIKNELEIRLGVLSENESRINGLNLAVKSALEAISGAKKDILDLAAQASAAKNEISDLNAKEQIFSAREKRLLIENAKVAEEKSVISESLNSVTEEAKSLRNSVEQISLKICGIKNEIDKEGLCLSDINSGISLLEREMMALESHKEFLGKLKTKYEDISESMNALIYLDKVPAQDISGLVVKIKGQVNLSDADKIHAGSANFKLSGEAKPFELDTKNIEAKLIDIGQKLQGLQNSKSQKESGIEELNQATLSLQQDLRQQEIALANKETSRLTVLEQFNKIKEEEEIILIELSDVGKEISLLEKSIESVKGRFEVFMKEQGAKENFILEQDRGIQESNKLREEVLILIARTHAELEGLRGRRLSDEATLKILEGAYQQDKAVLGDIEAKIRDGQAKKEYFESQMRENQAKIGEFKEQILSQKELLAKEEAAYLDLSRGSSESAKRIEVSRKEFDMLKDKLYRMQMQDKDIDYKYCALKERMLQVYKLDLEATWPEAQEFNLQQITEEIEELKKKIESYGTVNLVAIEEYDELKKRYDFLIQQESDLSAAKESLHQAILKINRTTKQMFMETFEKVRLEFRNYFKLLFNGGDAQVFLIDEQDPLESGIEIICRPPGKKLQNVLLLSGGEKSLSAIALIFAIFKVKPSPFCILDEIDAALDEANVDRFSRALHEFAKSSQFIVITHNKKTIANADLMYGITMQQSGVSKIVSVKFAKDAAEKDIDSQVVIPDAV
jgi:chromosome segregation protein